MFVTLMLKVTLQSYKVYDNVIELPDPKNIRNKKIQCSIAHILSEMRKVTCLTSENIRDLDVEGQVFAVQCL